MNKILFSLAACTVLSGCATSYVGGVYSGYSSQAVGPRDIFLSIDGTGNNQLSRTNAARLFEIVESNSGNAPRELVTYYAEGVGSNGSIKGLTAGVGMSRDIKEAFAFLAQTYDPKGRLFLSGFSRGAYAVRALAGMIAVGGIPDMRTWDADDRQNAIDALFDAYKIKRRTIDGRQESIAAHNGRRLRRMERVAAKYGFQLRGANGQTRVTAMAIWDTVEALGAPDFTMSPDEKVSHYYLAPCNVDHVFHALALDDNRAYSFTPIFATGKTMGQSCPDASKKPKVEEVWFAGAHADVGGSYAPGNRLHGHIPGVSLNWILDHLRQFNLFDPDARVFADPMGPVHDAIRYSVVYKPLSEHYRYPMAYHDKAGSVGRPRVHFTAFERLARVGSLDRAYPQCPQSKDNPGPTLLCARQIANFGLVEELTKNNCMDELMDEKGELVGYELRKGQSCVSVVCQEPTDSRFCSAEYAPAHSLSPEDKSAALPRPGMGF